MNLIGKYLHEKQPGHGVRASDAPPKVPTAKPDEAGKIREYLIKNGLYYRNYPQKTKPK